MSVKLTKTEQKVLELFALKSMSVPEVVETLQVSKRTIDFHLSNIFEKFGVSQLSVCISLYLRGIMKEKDETIKRLQNALESKH